jgi:hypothetical protein
VDQNSLVIVGREVVAELQRETFDFLAVLWVREEHEPKWRLWVVPRTYRGSREFYTAMSRVLTSLRKRAVDLDIADVRPIEPNGIVAVNSRRYGRVRPDAPIRLYSENLGGYCVAEGNILYHGVRAETVECEPLRRA